MNYEKMIDSLNEEFIQELFKYKKVAVDCPVSRKDAYNTAVGVFEKAFSGKYSSYDYCIIKDDTGKMDFLNNRKNKVTLYKFNLTDNYDTTMGYGNNGYQNSITSRSSDEVNKCRAVVRKVVVECNEKLRKLGLFSKSNGFNSTSSVPYYHINYIGNSIILNYNQEYKKVNRKTGEIKESAIEEGYEYCGSFIKK